MKINLGDQDLQILTQILSKYHKDFQFFAFGSRVKGTQKKYSDLDLAYISQTNETDLIVKLKNELQDSNLTINVDFVNYETITDEFRSLIDEHKVLWAPEI